MPWSGGVYTRGYPSWTNDANNNLPISATKFDLEDNDFASGLNNCLTIDGLNKPNATLNWAQLLALTRATDGNVLSIARTAGVNNPSLIWSVVETGNHVKAALNSGNIAIDLVPGAYTFGNVADNPTYTWLGSGIATFESFFQILKGAVAVVAGSQNALTIAQAGGPGIGLQNTTATSTNKNWDEFADATTHHYRVVADDYSSALDWMAVVRSGVTVTSVTFPNSLVKAVDQGGSSTWDLGWRDAPGILIGSGTTLALQHRGQMILCGGGGTPVTIPANSIVAFPIGSMIIIANESGGNVTIQINTDTLFCPALSASGTRTLANNNPAYLLKIGATTWWISGTGLS